MSSKFAGSGNKLVIKRPIAYSSCLGSRADEVSRHTAQTWCWSIKASGRSCYDIATSLAAALACIISFCITVLL
jgi:hypothetical protein